MKLLFASDSFKGSLTSVRTAELLTRAAWEVFDGCECISSPVADGGEGTVQAIITAGKGRLVPVRVHDPLMNPISAEYGMLENSGAVIEMAAASGLTLVPENQRNPRITSSFGTGEMILHALDSGCRDISIAIGGSATNDGGMGCARALGVRFLDQEGTELVGRGQDLIQVRHIDLTNLDPRIREARITILCDVKNPLCGKEGATFTFGRQKGADDLTLAELEAGMENYRRVILEELGIDCNQIPGSGAAGGLGAALKVFLGGEIRSGIETVLDLIHFDDLLEDVDLVVTGEGCTDAQSSQGKVIQGVASHARRKGIPVVALSGSLGEGAFDLFSDGVDSIMTAVDRPMSLQEAMKRAEELYLSAAVRMFRLIRIGMRLR